MKKLLMFNALIMLVVILSIPVTQAVANITDNFDSYSTGDLSVVSGGTWNTWNASSTDAQVTGGGTSGSNAMKQIGSDVPDVVTYSSVNLLGSSGAKVTASFDFLVHETGDSVDPVGYFFMGSGNAADSSINYGAGLTGLMIDWLYTDIGTTNITAYDSFGNTTLASAMATDQWQHVDMEIVQTVTDLAGNSSSEADGYYNVWLNGVLLTSNLSFRLDGGLNALEIFFYDDAYDDYILYDNISITSVVPVPGAILLGSIGVCLVGFIRRFKTA
jgi:hypothetical protein